ncbi:MAG: type II toxin-antitoxin system RelE/ParE family toxin [Dehalococcoidales bacterium]|nr:type II toxin-antitoxin system RelE/ParE family toxin [Dehalococcoidales bacterium]
MYEVELRRNAIKSLDRLQEPERSRIISVIQGLEQNPRPRGIEKIRGTELWRIREGDYRLVYHIDDERKIATIVRVGHRRDVYRGL